MLVCVNGNIVLQRVGIMLQRVIVLALPCICHKQVKIICQCWCTYTNSKPLLVIKNNTFPDETSLLSSSPRTGLFLRYLSIKNNTIIQQLHLSGTKRDRAKHFTATKPGLSAFSEKLLQGYILPPKLLKQHDILPAVAPCCQST